MSSRQHIMVRPRLGFLGNHLFVSCLLVLMLVIVQSKIILLLPTNWLHIDFVSIYVIYVAFEYRLGAACIRALWVAILLQGYSVAPQGFFLMYHVLILMGALSVSRFVVMHLKFIQGFFVFFFFSLKYFLYALCLYSADQNVQINELISFSLGPIISSSLASGWVFGLLAKLDDSLKFNAFHDRNQDSLERL